MHIFRYNGEMIQHSHRTSHKMTFHYYNNIIYIVFWIIFLLSVVVNNVSGMSEQRKNELKIQVKDMFYHAFNNYMKYAFPDDELNPLQCTGRGSDKNDPYNTIINDVLGDYSLTLMDSLDTFIVFNDKKEFEKAVRDVIKYVSFDLDSKVQVFEVNIRALGALLSAHLFITDPRFDFSIEGYDNELLKLAHDLGERLLPAFQKSKTGIPYARVNLKYGVPKHETHETCTAAAGTLIIEFGVLSRLTNDTRFEDVAKKALFGLWNRRTDLNLLGNVINVQTGQWIHTAASTGAGIDSFYEYLLKAYVLFGEIEYLDVFSEAYSSVLRYIRDETGYLYRNVNMMNGGLMSSWVDSLSAYFPGLQVLAGDLDNAIKSHLLYYNIWKKYRAMPERFNFHLRNVELATYPLRPEFIESTYFLYRATRDPFYLQVGEMIIKDLESYARVDCGFASVKDVLTKRLEERMESFILSETFKYLYLLFDTENKINRMDDNFIFTTEAHIILLPQKYLKNHSEIRPSISGAERSICSNYEKPSPSKHLFTTSIITSRSDADFARELVGLEEHTLPPLDPKGICEVPKLDPQVIEISFGDPRESNEEDLMDLGQEQQKIIKYVDGLIANRLKGLKLELTKRVDKRGYDVTKVDNYRVFPGQTFEIRDPSVKDFWIKQQTYQTLVLRVYLSNGNIHETYKYTDYITAVASFAPKITSELPIRTLVRILSSPYGCVDYNIEESKLINDNIIFVKRGGCTFVEKVLKAQQAGAQGVVIWNNEDYLFPPASPAEKNGLWEFEIPCVLITYENGVELDGILEENERYIRETKSFSNIKVRLLSHEREPITNIKTNENNEFLLTIHGHAIRNIRLNLNLNGH
ncbi:Glycoside Hydrolase Family 47 protein [Glomus cerebriforme]|uniref:alpha-1,2-Mannosidase n=1 Tax=Glomus cerebriforme TaxID=658196 RepID=A0A397T210_9GLOM|nr:Glycoside Hydrolase Family 47 protein [Glomus cerebriforme]